MNKNEIKAQLDAAWEKYYELEDKVNEAANKYGKESAEVAKLITECAAARQHRDELDAQYVALTQKGKRK